MAMNTPIQGTAADILKMAMIKIDEEFVKHNIKFKFVILRTKLKKRGRNSKQKIAFYFALFRGLCEMAYLTAFTM